MINQSDLKYIMKVWALTHLDEDEFKLPYQRLLALTKAIDLNRNGRIAYSEFKRFAEAAVRDMEKEYFGPDSGRNRSLTEVIKTDNPDKTDITRRRTE